jgi:hypothetical protein
MPDEHAAVGDEGRLGRRLERLEQVARGITSAELLSIGANVAGQSGLSAWPASERYWFSGVAGLDFDQSENRVMRQLWTRLLVGLAFTMGVDLDADGADVDRWQELEGQATSLLERQLGPDVWIGTVGIWNAFCAALLSERLDPAVRDALEAAWVKAVGLTPRERLIAEDAEGKD